MLTGRDIHNYFHRKWMLVTTWMILIGALGCIVWICTCWPNQIQPNDDTQRCPVILATEHGYRLEEKLDKCHQYRAQAY